MTAEPSERREALVLLLARNETLRHDELADLVLEFFRSSGRRPELAHRLRQALDAERVITDEWDPTGSLPQARAAVDALVEEAAR